MERDAFEPGQMLLSLDFNSHAHVERDLEFVWDFSFLNDFNSHAHVERDWSTVLSPMQRSISTHTLTWSVTVAAWLSVVIMYDFNSHAHVERD